MSTIQVEAPPQRETVPAKDRFQITFNQASELAKALPGYQFQFSAALVIVLGWLLTSQRAAEFLSAHPGLAKVGSAILVTCLIVFHAAWLLRHVRRAQALHRELRSLAQDVFVGSDALVESVRIDPFLPWSYMAVNGLICSAILIVCWAT
jgi:hypothetical protein